MSLKIFDSHTRMGAYQDGESIFNLDTSKFIPWVLVIGNEAHGISKLNTKLINIRTTIPKVGSGESLNASIAGSILLYHLTVPLLNNQ